MCVKLSFGNLNFSHYSLHSTNTYTSKVTITSKVHGGLFFFLIHSFVTLLVIIGPKIFLQFFYHNFNMTNCKGLIITYKCTHHFLFTNHTLPRHSYNKKL